jgi:hypothetical protein
MVESVSWEKSGFGQKESPIIDDRWSGSDRFWPKFLSVEVFQQNLSMVDGQTSNEFREAFSTVDGFDRPSGRASTDLVKCFETSDKIHRWSMG